MPVIDRRFSIGTAPSMFQIGAVFRDDNAGAIALYRSIGMRITRRILARPSRTWRAWLEAC